MSEQITLTSGLIAHRESHGLAGSTYSIELANPTTGRITVLRIQLPHRDDPEASPRLTAAWKGWEPRPFDALVPRWLDEAAHVLTAEVQEAERTRLPAWTEPAS